MKTLTTVKYEAEDGEVFESEEECLAHEEELKLEEQIQDSLKSIEGPLEEFLSSVYGENTDRFKSQLRNAIRKWERFAHEKVVKDTLNKIQKEREIDAAEEEEAA